MWDGDLCHPSPVDVAVLPVDQALEEDETASAGVFPEVFGDGKLAGSTAKGQCRLLAGTAAGTKPGKGQARFRSSGQCVHRAHGYGRCLSGRW